MASVPIPEPSRGKPPTGGPPTIVGTGFGDEPDDHNSIPDQLRDNPQALFFGLKEMGKRRLSMQQEVIYTLLVTEQVSFGWMREKRNAIRGLQELHETWLAVLPAEWLYQVDQVALLDRLFPAILGSLTFDDESGCYQLGRHTKAFLDVWSHLVQELEESREKEKVEKQSSGLRDTLTRLYEGLNSVATRGSEEESELARLWALSREALRMVGGPVREETSPKPDAPPVAPIQHLSGMSIDELRALRSQLQEQLDLELRFHRVPRGTDPRLMPTPPEITLLQARIAEIDSILQAT